MNRRANLRIAALAHDLASKINIDASFLAAEVQPGWTVMTVTAHGRTETRSAGLGKGEYLFQSSAWRDGDVAGLSGCVRGPGRLTSNPQKREGQSVLGRVAER